MKQYSIILYLFVNTIILVSCKKFVQVDPPINQITSYVVFSNEATANATITGLYSKFLNGIPDIYDGRLTILTSQSADDLKGTSPNTFEDAFYNNALLNNTNYVTNLWTFPYSYIYQANAAMEGIQKSTVIRDSVKNQLICEAKFLRAFSYFYLVNLFGDVPIVLNTDYTTNATLPRATVKSVYDQIIKDLKDVEAGLPEKYSTAERIRPNKFAATAMLARVYLYLKDYPNAEAAASLVINSNNYTLVTNLNNVFLANSNEAVWQLKPQDPNLTAINTSEGRIFIPASTSTIPSYVVSNFLLAAFETGDLRKTSWINSVTVSNTTYYYPAKYKTRIATNYSEYIMMLRFAEQYLIRAEARAHANNITGSLMDLNQVRKRAGLSNAAANDSTTLYSLIEHERQVEFFVEWGHRWFDLKRTGRADAILSIEKGATNWQSTDALYPIPISQLNTNIYLVQNDGY